jgi:hypothetical protein
LSPRLSTANSIPSRRGAESARSQFQKPTALSGGSPSPQVLEMITTRFAMANPAAS